ncbi:MAG: hypothetical protein M3275_00405 [Thermoproteota archaeon]|jgi:hypothetical protein|nr:hypothetical protein [Thermoproteota archaeon]
MSSHAVFDTQVQGLLRNLCQHLYMDNNLHSPFKAILLYCDIHFIERQFAPLAAKATSRTRKALGVQTLPNRSKNHDEK